MFQSLKILVQIVSDDICIFHQTLFIHNLQHHCCAYHVNQVAAKRRVQPTWYMKNILSHFVDACTRDKTADMEFLSECHHIRFYKIFVRPHFSGDAHADLYFVKNQHDIVFIAESSQFHKKFFSKMFIAAFRLNRFDDKRGNVVFILCDCFFHLFYRYRFFLFYLL